MTSDEKKLAQKIYNATPVFLDETSRKEKGLETVEQLNEYIHKIKSEKTKETLRNKGINV